MWKKIVVPLDGSDLAELALPYAAELANTFKSEVILLHVTEPSEDHYRRMRQVYMEEVAQRLKESVRKVSAVVVTGKPADEIISYVEKNDVGLVIITSHGRSGIMSWATGSIANKLLQSIELPLLLVRATKAKPRALKKVLLKHILLPLDGSKAGEAAVAYVGELMTRLEAEVTLFGVISSGQHIRTVGGLRYISYPPEEMAMLKKEAEEYLKGVYRHLKRRKGSVRVDIEVGAFDISQEILRFAVESGFNLIAISSHGHSGIEKWVFGSIANKVVLNSKVPVLLVKAVGAKL